METNTIVKQTEFYTIRRTEDGFVAELNSAALSGVPGLTNIELRDTSELILTIRATRVVNETICPTDVITRRIVATQRQAYQQNLLHERG